MCDVIRAVVSHCPEKGHDLGFFVAGSVTACSYHQSRLEVTSVGCAQDLSSFVVPSYVPMHHDLKPFHLMFEASDEMSKSQFE